MKPGTGFKTKRKTPSKNLLEYEWEKMPQSAKRRKYTGSVPKLLALKKSYKAKTGNTRGFIKGGRGPELKYFDTALNFSLDLTGEIPATGQLCLVPQSATENNRIGSKIRVKSIQIKGYVFFVPTTAATAACLGVIKLVLDKQCNGAAAAVADVVTGTNLGLALMNLDNRERFEILREWRIPFEATAGVTTAYNNSVRDLNFYKKLDLPIMFSSTTGAIGEITSNNLFLLAGTAGATDDVAAVTGTCRIRFTDN